MVAISMRIKIPFTGIVVVIRWDVRSYVEDTGSCYDF